LERAARLLGAAEAVLATIQAQMSSYDRQQHIPRVAALRAQMPEAALTAAWARGRALMREQYLAEAEAAVMESQQVATSTASVVRSTPLPAGLTAREVEVLRLLAQGLTDAQIAETLIVSTRTVNAHLRSIYGKLDVTTRTAAVRAAQDLHLV
jgi:DNA-binding NarL/FixJ family response regulator